MKKIIALLLVTVMIFTLAACGNKDIPAETDNNTTQNSQPGENQESSLQDKVNENKDIVLEASFKFMGFSIPYPAECSKNNADYGYWFGSSQYALFAEAPATAGIFDEVEKLSDVPAALESYICKALENKLHTLYTLNKTVQKIETATEVTYNGVNMLYTKGTLTNTETNKVTDFAAIYLLAGDEGNLPAYILGVPTSDGYDISILVEAMAKKISK